MVVRNISQVKNLLLRPATTSHFECFFNPPPAVASFMGSRGDASAGLKINSDVMERINISCCDASLPGSNLQLAQLTDSYPGVTENYAYRRAYDSRSDFTFYVDYLKNDAPVTSQPYTVILFFENWISYAINEKIGGPNETDGRPAMAAPNYFNRVNFAEDYIAAKIRIQKFEKEANGRVLNYDFINAFPFSIASMPVSYEASQVLKCTVSFSYQRYIVSTTGSYTTPESSPSRPPQNGIFNIPELAPNPQTSQTLPPSPQTPRERPLF